jgi:hypothetical protein
MFVFPYCTILGWHKCRDCLDGVGLRAASTASSTLDENCRARRSDSAVLLIRASIVSLPFSIAYLSNEYSKCHFHRIYLGHRELKSREIIKNTNKTVTCSIADFHDLLCF